MDGIDVVTLGGADEAVSPDIFLVPETEAGTTEAAAPAKDEAVGTATGSTEQQEPAPVVCGYCGWTHGSSRKIETTDDDRTEFMCSTLANREFTKRYTLFGGKCTLELRTLNPVIASRISKVLTEKAERGDFSKSGVHNHKELSTVGMRWSARMQMVKLVLPGRELDLSAYTVDASGVFMRDGTPICNVTEQEFDKHWNNDFMSQCSGPLVQAVMSTYGIFEQLCRQLELDICHPDF